MGSAYWVFYNCRIFLLSNDKFICVKLKQNVDDAKATYIYDTKGLGNCPHRQLNWLKDKRSQVRAWAYTVLEEGKYQWFFLVQQSGASRFTCFIKKEKCLSILNKHLENESRQNQNA